MTPWRHQEQGVADVLAAIAAGQRRVLLTSPTGMGKTRMVADLIRHYLDAGLTASLYTNRRLLLDQTSGVLAGYGLPHGVRAAGHADERDLPFQVSSIQTENSRSLRKQSWELHKADLVVMDEPHSLKGATAEQILAAHHDAGAAVVGVTATPIDLGHLYSQLVVAGTVSEGRRCGALVRCLHYGPDEPDLRHVTRHRVGEDYTEGEVRKAVMVPGIFARVYEEWVRLNPEQKPTILFAPGVKESVWFAEQFHAKGISAAHIDGEDVWVNGQFYRSSREARAEILKGSEGGRIRVVCNRFVLREGIDAPWLAHGIFATVFGSLQSFLQSGGRLLRNHPGLRSVTLQDHGGNWHRHGSLNADRTWHLNYTAAMYAGMREDAFRDRGPDTPPEPVRCPRCALILSGPTCPCGFVLDIRRKSRPVIQADGTLREMPGDVYPPRRTVAKDDTADLWKKLYYRARNSEMTFRQAAGLFAHENYYHPPRDLPLMPVDPVDFFRRVKDVPKEKLR